MSGITIADLDAWSWSETRQERTGAGQRILPELRGVSVRVGAAKVPSDRIVDSHELVRPICV
jgi:hypothetical protein